VVCEQKKSFKKICRKTYLRERTLKPYQLESLLEVRVVEPKKAKPTSVETQQTRKSKTS
jgi:hypothetical protein